MALISDPPWRGSQHPIKRSLGSPHRQNKQLADGCDELVCALRSNGTRPLAIWHGTTPSAQMSLRASAGAPRTSGASASKFPRLTQEPDRDIALQFSSRGRQIAQLPPSPRNASITCEPGLVPVRSVTRNLINSCLAGYSATRDD
jgi:hypothetical protein